MGIAVSFKSGAFSDVQVGGDHTINASIPIAVAFGGVGLVGNVNLSHVTANISATGILSDERGSRPFKLTHAEPTVVAAAATTRGKLTLDPVAKTLIFEGEELRGAQWGKAESRTLLSW